MSLQNIKNKGQDEKRKVIKTKLKYKKLAHKCRARKKGSKATWQGIKRTL